MVGRIQVKANDIAHLLDEERVGRELEATTAVRLYRRRLKHAMHRSAYRAPTKRPPAVR